MESASPEQKAFISRVCVLQSKGLVKAAHPFRMDQWENRDELVLQLSTADRRTQLRVLEAASERLTRNRAPSSFVTASHSLEGNTPGSQSRRGFMLRPHAGRAEDAHTRVVRGASMATKRTRCVVCCIPIDTDNGSVFDWEDFSQPGLLASDEQQCDEIPRYRGMVLLEAEPTGFTCNTCAGAVTDRKTPRYALCRGIFDTVLVPTLRDLTTLERRLISIMVFPQANYFIDSDRFIQAPLKDCSIMCGGPLSCLSDHITQATSLPPHADKLPLHFRLTFAGDASVDAVYAKSASMNAFAVRREALRSAILWLKENNALFASVRVDEEALASYGECGIPKSLMAAVLFLDRWTWNDAKLLRIPRWLKDLPPHRLGCFVARAFPASFPRGIALLGSIPGVDVGSHALQYARSSVQTVKKDKTFVKVLMAISSFCNGGSVDRQLQLLALSSVIRGLTMEFNQPCLLLTFRSMPRMSTTASVHAVSFDECALERTSSVLTEFRIAVMGLLGSLQRNGTRNTVSSPLGNVSAWIVRFYPDGDLGVKADCLLWLEGSSSAAAAPMRYRIPEFQARVQTYLDWLLGWTSTLIFSGYGMASAHAPIDPYVVGCEFIKPCDVTRVTDHVTSHHAAARNDSSVSIAKMTVDCMQCVVLTSHDTVVLDLHVIMNVLKHKYCDLRGDAVYDDDEFLNCPEDEVEISRYAGRGRLMTRLNIHDFCTRTYHSNRPHHKFGDRSDVQIPYSASSDLGHEGFVREFHRCGIITPFRIQNSSAVDWSDIDLTDLHYACLLLILKPWRELDDLARGHACFTDAGHDFFAGSSSLVTYMAENLMYF